MGFPTLEIIRAASQKCANFGGFPLFQMSEKKDCNPDRMRTGTADLRQE
jgi:hypothetical protein